MFGLVFIVGSNMIFVIIIVVLFNFMFNFDVFNKVCLEIDWVVGSDRLFVLFDCLNLRYIDYIVEEMI